MRKKKKSYDDYNDLNKLKNAPVVDNDIQVYTEDVETEDNMDYLEAVVPALAKIDRNKVIVDYQGYGLIVDLDDVNANSVTLKVSGEIGTSDFSFEVV